MISSIALFSDCISSFEILQQESRLGLSKIKIKLALTDGSLVFLREIIIQNVLHDYSYHWQRVDGTLIVRWDNTAHYPSISTYPHHKYVGSTTNVQPSYEQTLYDVLNFIKQQLLH